MSHLIALPDGTTLANDFRIERVLGAGGFGITYLAEEKTLARRVTIKEYFPAEFAARDGTSRVKPRASDTASDYRWGLERFIDEAKTLARFDHPNIVRVHRYFRANNTGYMVLGFEEGQSLKSWLKGLRRAPRQPELDRMVGPLLDALAVIHADDYLHRDIAPDNIIVRRDGTPVLIDFGSARGDMAQHSKTVSALVKPGYSPYEQYATSGRQQGPWTDIYSLAATLYQAVTGKRPPDAPSRMVTDEIVPARDAALSSYRPSFLAAIDQGLTLDITGRPRNVDEWRTQLFAETVKTNPNTSPSGPVVAVLEAVSQHAVAEAAQRSQPSAPPPSEPQLEKPRSGGSSWIGSLTGRLSKVTPSAPPAAEPAVAATPEPAPPPPRLAPRPARPPSRIRWRALLIKAIIGLIVASIAVAFQDHWRPGG